MAWPHDRQRQGARNAWQPPPPAAGYGQAHGQLLALGPTGGGGAPLPVVIGDAAAHAVQHQASFCAPGPGHQQWQQPMPQQGYLPQQPAPRLPPGFGLSAALRARLGPPPGGGPVAAHPQAAAAQQPLHRFPPGFGPAPQQRPGPPVDHRRRAPQPQLPTHLPQQLPPAEAAWLQALGARVADYAAAVAPTPQEQRVRDDVFATLAAAIPRELRLPRARVLLFGSGASGLALHCSDIDVVVAGAQPGSCGGGARAQHHAGSRLRTARW